MRNVKGACFLVAAVMCLSVVRFAPVAAQQGMRPLTIADEIGLTFFGGNEGDAYPSDAIRFSPNGKYVAVSTSHGDVAHDRVVADLRFYRSSDIENALDHPSAPQPVPAWSISVWSEEGPVIGLWQWLSDSSGVAFIRRNPGGRKSLVLADVTNKTLSPLSFEREDVGEYFDVHDRNNYAFTSVAVTTAQEKMQKRNAQVAILGTGRSIYDMVIPQSAHSNVNPVRLWVVTDGKRVEINAVDAEDYYFRLSPNGKSLVALERLTAPNPSWHALYLPSYVGDPQAWLFVFQYMRIDVQTSRMESLTDAPTGETVGWFAGTYASPSWSQDGQYIILPDTFLHANAPGSRPCIAVVEVASKATSCVEVLKGRLQSGLSEEGYQYIHEVSFADGNSQRVFVTHTRPDDYFAASTTEYQRTASGAWEVVNVYKGVSAQELGPNGLRVTVKQSLNDPPQLLAMNARGSRVIWVPNPRLKTFALGKVEVFNWKDDQGQDLNGGLYLPTGYRPGQRYPLVIQTHGFDGPSDWLPSGTFTTADAAMTLASDGIMVLQESDGNCPSVTPEEPACAVAGYAASAQKLIAQGMVDPDNIGLIGFSRTGMYVMKALTTNVLHLKAAAATDSDMLDYFQYVLIPEVASLEADEMIAPPFGDGLQKWLQLSSGFNFDKATTPLLDVGLGPASLLSMWLPYAMMHHLNKPVELVMLNMDDGPGTLPYEHVLTNPSFRLASQGGSVDWFRFWLQGYEDPDPAKATQYRRWEQLRKLQQANEAKTAAATNQ